MGTPVVTILTFYQEERTLKSEGYCMIIAINKENLLIV
jgi:hypothetical protein